MADEKQKDAAAQLFMKLEEMAEKCDEVQERVLAEILGRNMDTEYLKRHGLKGCIDRETFKSKVPIVTYQDIQPDLQRIANGDFSPILCAQPISEFLISSGTSAGKGKMIPTTLEELQRRLIVFGALTKHVKKSCLPSLDKGKGLYFMFIKAETETPGGLLSRTFSTSAYKSHLFRNRPYDPDDVYTSPLEAILCLDSFQSMYTQLLCGLYDRQLVFRIGSIFPAGLLKAIWFLQLHYPDLCHDISTGTLSPKITQPPLRACMAQIMRPDPHLADIIHEACRGHNWEGIIPKIWPNTMYLDVIVTGPMAQHIPTLDYYSGGLHKVCTMYVSSECFFGINLDLKCDPSEVTYTPVPSMGYFEFIPLHHNYTSPDSKPRPLDLVDLEVGCQYELVVTTYAGLYRYQVGDVLQVTGFYKSTPQFKFVRRKNVILSIDVDKTDELELQKAIENASILLQPFNANIVEYTSYVDTKTIPGHYVIFWELLSKDAKINEPNKDVLNQCCLAMEDALSSVYRQCRVEQQTVGPLEIRVVKNGTFEELMDQAISNGASINQYKVPSCVNLKSAVELLNSRVISHHFSPSMPHWNP